MSPRFFLPLALVALSVAAPMRAASSLAVQDLRCELAEDPLGIDVAQPRLSWTVASDERGQRQSSWQVVVASSPEALERGGDLWDSGRITSDQTTQILYSGAPLASSQRVYWKVRAWDVGGEPTAWSPSATWTMGLLAPADWKAQWITSTLDAGSLMMRREFTVRAGLVRALVHVSGLGQFELSLNGERVGEDLMSPGWTNYDKTTLYVTHEVTGLLHPGANAAGLMLGDGMYDVENRGRYVKFSKVFGPLRAILQLRLEYADGTVQYVGTGERWRVAPGPITAGNAYIGEDFDARLEPAGWNRPGFDDRGWTAAVKYGDAGGTLRGLSASDEPVRVIESRDPVSQRTLGDGSVVYDLGQNASTLPSIRVSGPAGSTVRLIPAEVVNADGMLDRTSMTADAAKGSSWWQYTKATDGEESWTPRFCYIGCRYLEAKLFPAGPEGVPDRSVAASALPRIDSLVGLVVHSTASPVGRFATSNDLINRIHTLVRWAQRSNMVSVLTDCPHREKLGWLAQNHLNGPSMRYEFNVDRIFEKDMNDMANAQHANGLIPNTAPEYAQFKGMFLAAAECGAAFIQVPWQQYQFTGDLALFRQHFNAMKEYYAYLESRTERGLLSEGLGDWFDRGPKRQGHAQLTLAKVTATAFLYEDALILGRAAELLGRSDDAALYTQKAAHIRAVFNLNFYDADTGTYAGDTQCANALALVMGLAEEADRPQVLDALASDIELNGYATTAGDVGFRYVLQALAQGGRSDVIYRMVNQDDQPGYGYQLRQGATSLTEAWDANRHSSQDHFMLGQVVEWFYRDLAGIDFDPAAPGFKRVVFRPQPVGDLNWVEAAYDSIHGTISSRWERRGSEFALNVVVPANTTATVYVPSADGIVAEGGDPAEDRPGVTFIGRQGDRNEYEILSGSYSFVSRWQGGAPRAAPLLAAASKKPAGNRVAKTEAPSRGMSRWKHDGITPGRGLLAGMGRRGIRVRGREQHGPH